jgi:putative transposase
MSTLYQGIDMNRTAYPTDLTDAQWKRTEKLIPSAKIGGRPRTTEMREIMDAILYLTRGGIAWRLLPHDFPAWSTVYHYFRTFKKDGTWIKIHDSLRDEVRQKDGRKVKPSAAIIDSQSVKTTEKKGFAVMTPGRK